MQIKSDRRALKSTSWVMSCDEILYWMRWLKEHHGWGKAHLAAALGLYDPCTAAGKMNGRSFIYVTEQRRMSRLIPRILSGELVKIKVGNRHDVMVADNPVPLRLPPQMAFDFKTGRLCWRVPRIIPKPTMPGWNRGIANTTEVWGGWL